MKFDNHEICQVLMIPYEEVVKKIENVLNTWTRSQFRNWNISREVYKIWTNVIRFGVLEKFKIEFDYKYFSTCNIQYN
jgi:hypothetical protein